MDLFSAGQGRLATLAGATPLLFFAAADPAATAQAWLDGLARSGDKIKRGVQNVTTSPGAAAARQADAWAANTAAAKAKFAANVGRLSLADWQNAMMTKGVDRIATGAASAVPKMQSFLTTFLPYVENARRSLPARGSYEQNKARANAMMDQLHKFTRTGR